MNAYMVHMMRKIVFAFCTVLASIGALLIAGGFALVAYAGYTAMKMED